MVTEDYVSFETAKLLKEKGFDEKVDTLYKMDGEFLKSTLCINYNDAEFRLSDIHNIPENTVSAPTFQMVMKWLREVHRLHCNIGYDNVNWYWDIQTVRKPVTEETAPKMLPAIATIGLKYSTYEEACEAAVKYCLENLI